MSNYTPETGDVCLLWTAPCSRDQDGDICLVDPDASGFYRYTRAPWLSNCPSLHILA